MHQYWKTINDHSRTTYYVLPLIYLNKFSFGTNNFVHAYMTPDSSYIIVKVKSMDPEIVGALPFASEHYAFRSEAELVFYTPSYYLANGDIERFRRGKYSEMSDSAKDMIRAYSGLNYRIRSFRDGVEHETTDARLRALDKSEAVRNFMNELLGLTGRRLSRDKEPFDEPIDENSELMSAPAEWEFRPVPTDAVLV